MRTPRLASVCAATTLLLVTIASGTTPVAQVRQPTAAARPGWLPRDIIRLGGPLTAAQRATAIARLEETERILHQVPELAPALYNAVWQTFQKLDWAALNRRLLDVPR